MRIAIASDLHLGYDWGGERQEDSFGTAMEIMNKASQADVLILAGDIFDSKMPRQEIVARAFRIFKELKIKKSDAKLVSVRNREGNEKNVNPLSISGFPIVAIFGTHERRARTSTNPVQLMEEAGYLVCLHGDVAIIKKGEEKVAIHGMSGVPEIYARAVLNEMDFRPIEGMRNIFVMHQSIKGFVYMDEDNPTLMLEDLPKGFDLVVNGHIHWANELDIGEGSRLLIPGSSIATQIRKTESIIPKYMYFYDSESGKVTKERLTSARECIYIELDCTGMKVSEIKQKLRDELSKVTTVGKKRPIIRIVLNGNVDESAINSGYEDVLKNFKHKAIISLTKKLVNKEMAGRNEEIRKLIENSSDINRLMTAILEKNARKENITFNVVELVELLSEDKLEDAERLVLEGINKNKDSEKETSRKETINEKHSENFINTSKGLNYHNEYQKKSSNLFDFSKK